MTLFPTSCQDSILSLDIQINQASALTLYVPSYLDLLLYMHQHQKFARYEIAHFFFVLSNDVKLASGDDE